MEQIEAELDNRFAQVTKALSAFRNFQSRLPEAARAWANLKVDVIEKDAGKSFKLHTELVKELHREVTFLVDYFGVVMQSNRDEYYLSQLMLFQVPELQEVLGQLRGRGAGALTDQYISVEERATLVGLQYGVERSFANILQQFALLSSNSSLGKYFSAEINRFEAAAGNFRDLFVEKSH